MPIPRNSAVAAYSACAWLKLRGLNVGFTVLFLAVVLSVVYRVGSRACYQWDFDVYYFSARAFAQHIDPYRKANLQLLYTAELERNRAPNFQPNDRGDVLAGARGCSAIDGPYRYTPMTLYFFSLFTLLPIQTALKTWIALKVLIALALVVLWNQKFIRTRGDLVSICFLAFAFDSPLLRDLTAGNVSTFEQFGLWLAFGFLLSKQFWPFAICTILAAQFKLWPAVFLLLPLVVEQRPKLMRICASGLAFLALVSVNALLSPSLFMSFLRPEPDFSAANYDFSTRELIRVLSDSLPSHGYLLPGSTEWMLHFLFTAGVIGISYFAVFKYRTQLKQLDPKILIFFSCVVCSLILPSFRDYSYILVLIPALYIVRTSSQFLIPVLAMLGIVAPREYVPFFHTLSEVSYHFLPLFVLYLVFAMYVVALRRPASIALPGMIYASQPEVRPGSAA